MKIEYVMHHLVYNLLIMCYVLIIFPNLEHEYDLANKLNYETDLVNLNCI